MSIARMLFGSALMCSATLVSAACAVTDPVVAARSLYSNHRDFHVADHGDTTPIAASLLKLLERDWVCQEPGEQCAISADPWTNAQDGDVLKSPHFERLAGTDPLKAVVEMTYPFGWQETAAEATTQTTQIVLSRSKEDACWLLEDLRVGASSLRETLESAAY